MSDRLDLSSCDREAIHIPGSVQPHGVLFVVRRDDHIVEQVSASVRERLGAAPESIIGVRIEALWDSDALCDLISQAGHEPTSAVVAFKGRPCEATVHSQGPRVVLEIVPDRDDVSRSVYHELREALSELRHAVTVRQLAEGIAGHVCRIGGFDRVMIYRFLEDDSGVVIAESRHEELAPYLGLHYPATDIPKQARALYLKNWIRTIHAVDYAPSALIPELNPTTGEPLDMSRASLRSVSPIHIEYLKNMGVGASMSVSLVRENRLWGLIACHHREAWYGGADVRGACELIGQIASLQIETVEVREERQYRDRALNLHNSLVRRMTEGISAGLSQETSELLDLVNASGAAVVHAGRVVTVGATPTEGQIQEIVRFLGARCWPEAFATECLSADLPSASDYSGVASGLLAACHSHRNGDYVLWFRPEYVRTVTWAGNPHKPAEPTPGERLRPRSSFAEWQETVRHRSRPWKKSEIQAATELRIAILEAEIVALNQELERRVADRTEALQKAVDELNGFTYSVSHDLRTPLRSMVGHSRILIEEHAGDLDRRVRDGLTSIETAALKMSALVDDLLQYARLGRQEVRRQPIDLSQLAAQALGRLTAAGWPCENASVRIEPGLKAEGDPALIEIVLTTLLDNGCKYRHLGHGAQVEFGKDDRGFFVRNRGIGFDMRYLHKVFEPFQRLHRDEEYPGTGIGLANAKRIVERHGGQIWAEGRPGEGATFWFTL